MRHFLDCNLSVGVPCKPIGWRLYQPEAVRQAAQAVGILQGYAYHVGALEVHPLDGNAEMELLAQHDPFFLPVWVLMPNATGEFYDTPALKRQLDIHGIEMVRLFPRYNSLSYSLSDWSMGEQLSMLETRGTPVLLDQEQTDWETVHQLCCSHPSLKLIITNCYYRHARYLMALMKAHPNLFAETSGMKSFGLLQTYCEQVGADRLVFGSNLGTLSAGSAVSLVNYALISEKEKEQIAYGTLEALLGRQVL